jgi:hypothetical protein
MHYPYTRISRWFCDKLSANFMFNHPSYIDTSLRPINSYVSQQSLRFPLQSSRCSVHLTVGNDKHVTTFTSKTCIGIAQRGKQEQEGGGASSAITSTIQETSFCGLNTSQERTSTRGLDIRPIAALLIFAEQVNSINKICDILLLLLWLFPPQNNCSSSWPYTTHW